jgi:ADP-ribose pyrophosphatase YjhB (NUDIX family)
VAEKQSPAPAEQRRAPRKKPRRAEIETSSGGVVFRRSGRGIRFLLIRDPYENWGLPKGHLEGGETPQEAAMREVAEETGLSDLDVRAELPTIDWYFRDGRRLVHKFCHFFLIESAEGEPVPQADEGISACLWCSYRRAVRTLTYDNAREVLRAAGRELGTARRRRRSRPGPAPRPSP